MFMEETWEKENVDEESWKKQHSQTSCWSTSIQLIGDYKKGILDNINNSPAACPGLAFV